MGLMSAHGTGRCFLCGAFFVGESLSTPTPEDLHIPVGHEWDARVELHPVISYAVGIYVCSRCGVHGQSIGRFATGPDGMPEVPARWALSRFILLVEGSQVEGLRCEDAADAMAVGRVMRT